MFLRYRLGAILRHMPLIPRVEASISSYSRRRVDGKVQSIVVSGRVGVGLDDGSFVGDTSAAGERLDGRAIEVSKSDLHCWWKA